MGEGMRFAVLRAVEGKGVFAQIHCEIVRRGLSFNLVDRTVEYGKTYGYRVDVSDELDVKVLFDAERTGSEPT